MSTTDRKPASAVTADANAAVAAALPTTTDDFADATRGRIAPLPGPVVHPTFGHAVWDPADWEFITGAAPASVNPSLWRQAQLNAIHGLFEVGHGVYQVRGVDLSNITFIAGDTGWIVIDPLTVSETAAFALELLHAHLPARPVHAVIYTHSHVDHFGGVRGVITDADVTEGRVQVIAPVGFLEAAIKENVVAGPAMLRRASYMYGRLLPGDPQGHVDCGLGKAIPLLGTSGLIAPTVEITTTGEEMTVDGVRLRFQYTPDTEAPAEMNIFLPDRRMLCMAENCSSTLHNVYTPRGAQIRDSLAWSKYLHESIDLFVGETDIVFMSHHWPRVGTERVREFMAEQRDAYRWIHDQTMRRANHGETPLEIAETLGPPPGMDDRFHVRGYYGTLSHNAKAVYQRYLGWFDANPAHLHALPPVEVAVKYVEFMGGADAVIEKAKGSIAAGEYRWAAEVLNHVVFAEPDHREAQLLQADVLEQLGYRAESGPWRDFYLTGANELRHGAPHLGGSMASSLDVLRAMTTEMLVDLMGVRLNGDRVGTHEVTINLTVTDAGEHGAIGVVHGALHFTPGRHVPGAAVELAVSHLGLARLASGLVAPADLDAADLTVTGDASALDRFLGWLDTFDASFAIVTADDAMDAGYETLDVHRDGPVGWLVFDRPDAGNAMDATMLGELERAWRELDADPEVRVIVNTGKGSAFQTGLDVGQLARDPEALREQSRRTRDSTLRLTAWHNQVTKPVVAAVNGVCAGGGLHFVADADIVIAATTAAFLDPHVSIGQVSALETIALAKQSPMAAITRMAFVGRYERIDAVRAMELGILSEVVDSDRLRARAQEIGATIARNSPAALAATKRALWGALELGLTDACRAGAQELVGMWGHPDQVEGPAVFAEQRDPVWLLPGTPAG